VGKEVSGKECGRKARVREDRRGAEARRSKRAFVCSEDTFTSSRSSFSMRGSRACTKDKEFKFAKRARKDVNERFVGMRVNAFASKSVPHSVVNSFSVVHALNNDTMCESRLNRPFSESRVKLVLFSNSSTPSMLMFDV
jgi:hypothetical protein